MDQNPTKAKMYHNFYSVASILLFVISSHFTIASPVIRSSRMVREIYPEVEQEIPDSSQTQVCIVGDVVYGPGEGVPSEQPCLKCACAPPDVRCETEKCVQQPGCKTIHRPNKCCPDYQCECQHEGKSYANGERLPSAPGGECLVCYCRGGEVQCAEVGCYTRSDCEPRYVTGECCPKYDHCPPREPTSDQLPNQPHEPTLTSVDPEVISSWPSTGHPENTSSLETPEDIEGSGEAEDTSPTPSPTPITTPNPIQGDEPKRSSTPITFSIKDYDTKTKKPEVIPKINKTTQTDSEGRPQITIQEVIPELTEFKSPQQKDVPNRSVSVSPINPVTYKNLESSTTNSNDNDVESYASEKTEVYDHPPPVLRIGDQLLFIKQGQLVPEKDASTPSPVITLIGAEGLQIGLGSGELLDHEIIPVNREEATTSNSVTKRLDSNESKSTESTTADSRESTPEVISSEDLSDTETSSNDSVLTSNEFIPADVELTDPKSEELSSTEASINYTSEERSSDGTSERSTSERSTSEHSSSSTTDRNDYVPEENPYYPAIPEDIMNVQEESSTESALLKSTTPSTTTEYLCNTSPDPSVTTSTVESSSAESLSAESSSTASVDSSSESAQSPQTESTVLSIKDTPKIRLLLYAKSSDEVTSKLFVTPVPALEPVSRIGQDESSNVAKHDNSEIGNEEMINTTEDLSVEGLKEHVQAPKENKSIEEITTKQNDSNEEKILPEVLEMRNNQSIASNGTQEWLKENPTKISIPFTKESKENLTISQLDSNIQEPKTSQELYDSKLKTNEPKELEFRIPLINSKAALPDHILKEIVPSDLLQEDNVTNTESSEGSSEETTNLSETNIPTRTLLETPISSESNEASTLSAEEATTTNGVVLSTKVAEIVISAKDYVNTMETKEIMSDQPTISSNGQQLKESSEITPKRWEALKPSKEELNSKEDTVNEAKVSSNEQSKEDSEGTSQEELVAISKEIVTKDESLAKIVVPTKEDLQSSKETLEQNVELFSDESTTMKSTPIETLSNDDASLEIVQNDSAPLDILDAVEMLPGFQKSTPITFKSSEEQLRDQPSPKDEVEMISGENPNVQTHVEFKSTAEEVHMFGDEDPNVRIIKEQKSPKTEVEIISPTTEDKEQSKAVPYPKEEVELMHDPNTHETNVEFKDFHEEIQKRDVVKKVLKDIYENPKENIRTDLTDATEDPALDPTNQNSPNEEFNAVKPIEFHDLSTRSLNPQIYNSSLSNKVAPNKLNSEVSNKNLEETEVIQKVKHDNSKIQESTDTLDTGALGVLRDFFQTQFRHYQDSRSAD